jgi:hypothetical protein
VPITLATPTRRRGLTTVSLGPVPDEVAREVFDWGYCHILACALHEITGWAFSVVEQYRYDLGAWTWVHAGVLVPDSALLLDIHGTRSWPEVERGYTHFGGPFRIRSVTSVREFYASIGYPADTPPGWWRDQLTGEAGEAVRRLARYLVDAAGHAAPGARATGLEYPVPNPLAGPGRAAADSRRAPVARSSTSRQSRAV